MTISKANKQTLKAQNKHTTVKSRSTVKPKGYASQVLYSYHAFRNKNNLQWKFYEMMIIQNKKSNKIIKTQKIVLLNRTEQVYFVA